MKHIKSTLALLLCAVTLLASCAQEQSTAKNAEKSTETNVETEVTTEADPLTVTLDSLPANDYEGYVFRILDRANYSNGVFKTIDVWSDEMSGDPINDAVYERNSMLCEKYNIKIEAISPEGDAGAISSIAAKSITAGDDTFDTITEGITYLANKLQSQGMLYDLFTIEGLNVNGEAWDAAFNEGAAIANKLYFSTGDISIMDNYGTWCMFFNKDILKNYNIEDLYVATLEGRWTLEMLYNYAKATARDLDGDGKLTDADHVGYISESFNKYALWVGGGESIVSVGKDGIPVLSMYNDRSESVFEAVERLHSDKSCSRDPADRNAQFSEGKATFLYGGMWLISHLRSSETDFGIIPAPKYDEQQERYYSTFSHGNFTAYSIPITIADTERTGTILEAMAAISKYTLTPAYFDVSLESKFLRDENSFPMLETVLDSRMFDLGLIYDTGGLFSSFSSIKSGSFASNFEKKQEKAQAALDTIYADYSE